MQQWRWKMKELVNEMMHNTAILMLLMIAVIIALGTFFLGLYAGISSGIALHEFLDMGVASAVLSIIIGALITSAILGALSTIGDYIWRLFR